MRVRVRSIDGENAIEILLLGLAMIKEAQCTHVHVCIFTRSFMHTNKQLNMHTNTQTHITAATHQTLARRFPTLLPQTRAMFPNVVSML